jgi:hypothetical protein
MACGTCGGTPAVQWQGNEFHPELEPDAQTNDRGMFLLAGDTYDCEPYSGMYPGTTLFLACGGTNDAQVFLITALNAALDYAAQHECGVQRISVLSLCHDKAVGIFGA